MDKKFLITGKRLVESFDLIGLQELYQDIITYESEYRLPKEYLYQQIFLHACQYNFVEAISFLFQVYQSMDIIQKKALRQLFFYGKYLLDKEYHQWYSKNIIKDIRVH